MVAIKKVEKHTEYFDAEMPLRLLDDAPDNPRKQIGDVAELAESIKQKGLIHPLLVTPIGKRFLVVAGHRRKAASLKAGRSTVPCIVRTMTEAERIEIMLVENIQREDLKPSEEAASMHALEGLGFSQREIAEKIGKSQPHVNKRLQLLKLPVSARAKVDSGGITLEDAATLVKIADHPKEIERLLKNGGGHLKWAVEDVIKKQKRAAAVAKTRAKLKREGAKVLKNSAPGSYGFRPPQGAHAIGKGWGELDIDAKAHASLPCHAVGIGPDGKIVPCCTDRAAHPEVKTRGEEQDPGREAREAALRAREAELAAASERRRGLLLRIMDDVPGLEMVLARDAVGSADPEVIEEVARLLDIELEALPPENWTLEAQRARAAVEARNDAAVLSYARTATAASRLVTLIALVTIEVGLEHRRTWSDRADYFALLATAGHEPCAAETDRLQSQGPDLGPYDGFDEDLEDLDEDLEDEDDLGAGLDGAREVGGAAA